MGVYWQKVTRTPAGVTSQGIPLHAMMFATRDGSWMTKAVEARILGPTRKAWEDNPATGPLFLVDSDESGKVSHGMRVYGVESVARFTGVLLDVFLGGGAYPWVGTLLMDGKKPEVVTREQEIAAWIALGAPWRSSIDALRNNHKSYRPSIDCSTPEGLLAARLYDAAAEVAGDSRRAYRYREAAA